MFDKSFIKLVAIEGSLPSVDPSVFLQLTGSRASIVALGTLEWPFSGTGSHHMFF